MVQSRPWVAAALVLLLAAVAAPAPATAAGGCPTSPSPAARAYRLAYDDPTTEPTERVTATGYVALPATPARALVLVSHGFTSDAALFRNVLADLARAGAVAVALDFRGDAFAYKVRNATEDNAAALADWVARCPVATVVLYGGSMGGQVSALTAMRHPEAIDYLVLENSPSDLPELWATLPAAGVAVAAAAAEPGAQSAPRACGQPVQVRPKRAAEDGAAAAAALAQPFDPRDPGSNLCAWGLWSSQQIEAEMGGPPAGAALPAYVRHSPALDGAAWLGTDLRHVYLVHAGEDPVVPADHSVQLAATLQAALVPTSLYLVPYFGSVQAPGPLQASGFFEDVRDASVAYAKQATRGSPGSKPSLPDVPAPAGLELPTLAMHKKSIGIALVHRILAGTDPAQDVLGVPVPLDAGLATPDHDPLAQPLMAGGLQAPVPVKAKAAHAVRKAAAVLPA